ncbi:DUF1579 domain-containing protein [Altericista sp. CCNU0014]|uniref:DUF1579 domain-containing protein n=1 Tax=Altericista sp. CCNU0014 TaxID=3082949 RepID=UPI00384EF7BF
MEVTLQKEHQWLDRLIGEWTYESECIMGPDQPPLKSKGTEVVRSLGGVWIVAEGEGEMPDGNLGKTIMTLGFDPKKNRFVGTFICSVMTYLWPYNGSLDAEGKILTLDSEGPNFSNGEIAPYQDIIEFVSNDRKILTSKILMDDGTWNQFMTAHYHRQK